MYGAPGSSSLRCMVQFCGMGREKGWVQQFIVGALRTTADYAEAWVAAPAHREVLLTSGPVPAATCCPTPLPGSAREPWPD